MSENINQPVTNTPEDKAPYGVAFEAHKAKFAEFAKANFPLDFVEERNRLEFILEEDALSCQKIMRENEFDCEIGSHIYAAFKGNSNSALMEKSKSQPYPKYKYFYFLAPKFTRKSE